MNAVDMSEKLRKGQLSLDQLLSSPSSEVMTMFLHELRQYPGLIEIWSRVLLNKDVASQHEVAIEELRQVAEKTRDVYDFLFNYLEKLQDMRQSGNGHG